MKRTVTLMLVFLLTIPSIFAKESLKSIVRDFQRNNSEYVIVIPSFLIKMGLAFGDMEDEEREVLEMIDDLKIVVCEKRFDKANWQALDEGIKDGAFTELMTVNDKDEKVRMVINKKSERKTEMLMIVESNDENVLLLFNFYGEPDMKKFMSLAD